MWWIVGIVTVYAVLLTFVFAAFQVASFANDYAEVTDD